MRRPNTNDPRRWPERGRPARQSSVVGFIDAAGTDLSTDAVPSLLMQGILKKDNRRAAPVVTRAVAGGVSKYQISR